MKSVISLGLNTYLLLFLVLSRNVNTVGATDCGKWYSSDCLADSDVRYKNDADDASTNHLIEQAPFWRKYQGYYRVEQLSYGPNGEPVELEPRNLATGLGMPYQLFRNTRFVNLTVAGARVYQHMVAVLAPATEDFCAQSFPPGNLQVFPPGVCGVNGFAFFGESFGTSTYEKDGSLASFPPVALDQRDFRLSDTQESSGATPVNAQTLFQSSTFLDSDGFELLATLTTVCVDVNCDQITVARGNYRVTNTTTFLIRSESSISTRIATPELFVQQIQDAYNEHNVPEANQIPVPMMGNCLAESYGGTCPTEDDWCTQDPTCSTSPYQEPDATIKAGPIVGIVAAGFFVILVMAYGVHRYQMAQQAERNRTKFARRIAETIHLEGSTRQMTPEGLASEFQKIIRSSGNGSGTKNAEYISRDDLWRFISSGKAGELSVSDFNALFVALDANNDGRVNFLEFCTFMGQCNDEFERVKNRKSVLRARPSKAHFMSEELNEVASFAARRISQISRRNLPVDVSAPMTTVDEEGGKKDDVKSKEDDPTETA